MLEEYVSGVELNGLIVVRDGEPTLLTLSDRLRPDGLASASDGSTRSRLRSPQRRSRRHGTSHSARSLRSGCEMESHFHS